MKSAEIFKIKNESCVPYRCIVSDKYKDKRILDQKFCVKLWETLLLICGAEDE